MDVWPKFEVTMPRTWFVLRGKLTGLKKRKAHQDERMSGMPVKAVKRGDKARVVEADTGRIAVTRKGNPVDGGGHETMLKAKRQARAINSHAKRDQ